jgi:hypothetical protein
MSSLTGEETANIFTKYYDIISAESDRGEVIEWLTP